MFQQFSFDLFGTSWVHILNANTVLRTFDNKLHNILLYK